jgi:predicted amidohydrolase
MKETKQISKIRDENDGIAINVNETERIFKVCFMELKNIEEMDKFLGVYDLQNLIQEDKNHLNRSIAINNAEIIKNHPKMKSPGPEEFTAKFYWTFKEELTPMIFK